MGRLLEKISDCSHNHEPRKQEIERSYEPRVLVFHFFALALPEAVRQSMFVTVDLLK